ncbi:MAG: serine hydrolase domain-containing protein [Steroidobacteraceae bacterium]
MPDRRLAVDFEEKRIDGILAPIDPCHGPGLAAGIAIEGRPVYRKAFGLASADLPLVLSPTTRMRIGSVTKQFSALAYLLLCEEGKASLDSTIGELLPELHPVSHPVTMRQLLGHTSGLRDTAAIKLDFSGTHTRPVSATELVQGYSRIDDVAAPAGTTWAYNNGGYLIVSAALERISGQPLEGLFRSRLFEPIGLRATLVRRWDSDYLMNSASPHTPGPSGGWMRADYGMENFAGGGAIASTVDDLLRWMAHMDDPIVGTAATWAAMKTPQTLFNGAATHYGLGLNLVRYRGTDLICHQGGGVGCNAMMLKAPAAALDLVILSNCSDMCIAAGQLAFKVLDACLPGLDPLEAPSEQPPAVGTYRSPRTGRIIQLIPRDGQQMVSINAVDMPFRPDPSGLLRPAVDATGWTVSLQGGPPEPSSVRFSDFGNVEELQPVPRPRSSELRQILGQYRSESICTQAIVRETDSGAQLRTMGAYGSVDFELECIARDVWRVRAQGPVPHSGVLAFDADGGAFHFSNFANQSLLFHRC